MANDANGNAIVIGDRYVIAGRVRHEAETDRVQIVGDRGAALEVDPGDLVPIGHATGGPFSATSHNHSLGSLSDVTFGALLGGELVRWNSVGGYWESFIQAAYAPLSHNHAETDLVAAALAKLDAGALVSADSYLNGTGGLSSTASGSPTHYVNNPRYTAPEQDDASAPMVKIDGQSSTGSTQARIVYYASRVWLADGRAFRFRVRANNSATGSNAFRLGLHSDDDTSPNATGRPAGGVWVEWDKSVSSSVVYLCASDGSTVTAVACSTLTLSDIDTGPATLWLVFESTSSVKLYADDGDGTHTLEATATTNVPSDAQSRSVRPFLQLEKDDTNTTRPELAIEPPAWTRDSLAGGATPPA